MTKKLLKAISSIPFKSGELSINCSVSIGFSCFPFYFKNPRALSWEHVSTLTDKALYIAKNNGRNQGCSILIDKKNKEAIAALEIPGFVDTAIEKKYVTLESVKNIN